MALRSRKVDVDALEQLELFGDGPLADDAVKALTSLLVDAAERGQQTDPADDSAEKLEGR